jgi:hypothetical protein
MNRRCLGLGFCVCVSFLAFSHSSREADAVPLAGGIDIPRARRTPRLAWRSSTNSSRESNILRQDLPLISPNRVFKEETL